MASHIEKSYKRRGTSTKTAEARAWATVNKQTGGAKGKKSSRSKGGTRRKASRRRTSSKRS
jgi:hypothetical protein